MPRSVRAQVQLPAGSECVVAVGCADYLRRSADSQLDRDDWAHRKCRYIAEGLPRTLRKLMLAQGQRMLDEDVEDDERGGLSGLEALNRLTNDLSNVQQAVREDPSLASGLVRLGSSLALDVRLLVLECEPGQPSRLRPPQPPSGPAALGPGRAEPAGVVRGAAKGQLRAGKR
jgi:hypothetical protein